MRPGSNAIFVLAAVLFAATIAGAEPPTSAAAGRSSSKARDPTRE